MRMAEEEHWRASELPSWYPLLEGLTPKSLWFSRPPNDGQECGYAGVPPIALWQRIVELERARHGAAAVLARRSP